jgi:hypothetical protein
MAWGKQPTEQLELVRAQVELEFLREENKSLKQQVEKLQDALVAASAPKAYDQILRDKELPETKEELEKRRDALKQYAYIADYLEEMEKPSFESTDEMTNWLSSGFAKTSMADTPIDPNNRES